MKSNWAKGKIIFTDYDGTYYSRSGAANAHNRAAVAEFTAAGGRDPRMPRKRPRGDTEYCKSETLP